MGQPLACERGTAPACYCQIIIDQADILELPHGRQINSGALSDIIHSVTPNASTWSGLRLRVRELWGELFTRASFLIGQSRNQGE
jgi:hypothetical protein